MLNQVSTKDLTSELVNRPGIKSIILEPYKEIKITTDSSEVVVQGPAVILVNQD
jgi:hypothetical protein